MADMELDVSDVLESMKLQVANYAEQVAHQAAVIAKLSRDNDELKQQIDAIGNSIPAATEENVKTNGRA